MPGVAFNIFHQISHMLKTAFERILMDFLHQESPSISRSSGHLHGSVLGKSGQLVIGQICGQICGQAIRFL